MKKIIITALICLGSTTLSCTDPIIIPEGATDCITSFGYEVEADREFRGGYIDNDNQYIGLYDITSFSKTLKVKNSMPLNPGFFIKPIIGDTINARVKMYYNDTIVVDTLVNVTIAAEFSLYRLIPYQPRCSFDF